MNSQNQQSLWKVRSLDMGLTNRGIAVGGTWRHSWNRVQSTPVQISALFFRESNKIPVYDYRTGYYINPPSKKIVFLNLRSGFQHRIWADDIAQNVQPYLFASGGPSIALDPGNNTNHSFITRWQKTTVSYTANLFAGAGVDFVYSRSSQFSLTVGYEVMYFPEQVDGLQNYSGVMVLFSFGERL